MSENVRQYLVNISEAANGEVEETVNGLNAKYER